MQVLVSNIHHTLIMICCVVHTSHITQKLWLPEVSEAHNKKIRSLKARKYVWLMYECGKEWVWQSTKCLSASKTLWTELSGRSEGIAKRSWFVNCSACMVLITWKATGSRGNVFHKYWFLVGIELKKYANKAGIKTQVHGVYLNIAR